MRLILVRHGETSWNAERRIQGGSGGGLLSLRGKEQVQKLALSLRRERLEAIYSSPRERALETAQAIAQPHKLEVSVEPDLREMEVGLADGMTFDECRQAFPQFWEEIRAGQGLFQWPGGESLPQLVERVKGVMVGVRQRHPQGTAVVVSHFYTLNALLLWAFDLDISRYTRLGIAPASLSILNWDGDRPVLVQFNDTCHWR